MTETIDYQIPNHNLTKLLNFKDSFYNSQLNNFVELENEIITGSDNTKYKTDLIKEFFNMIFGEERNLRCTINILFRN